MIYSNKYQYKTPLLNGIGTLGVSNSKKKLPFFTQDGNNARAVILGGNTDKYPSKNYNPYLDNNSNFYKKNYDSPSYSNSSIDQNNYKYNNNSYNYGLSSQTQTSKKNLPNSIINSNDYIYDKNYEKRKPSYNDELNDNYKSSSNSNIYYKSIISSRVGLKNLGNTCFMNTCLQNLIHSEDFIKRLISKSNMINSNTPITLKFYNLCQNMAAEGKGSIFPDEFKLKFGSKHSLFSGYGQNDTQEFCRILLEDMNKELNEGKPKAPYKELNTSGKSKIECDEEFDKLFRKRESSIVMDSFYAQIINIFTCKCKYNTFSFQKILDFPLLLRNTNSTVTLFELLDDYFDVEYIQFDTKCENCKKRREHKKEIKISRPPNILILSIQRINGRTKRKNNCVVEFSEKLNIKKYIDTECGYGKECEYELYGVGNHSGNIDFGHYFAYVKLNGNWYEFNDSIVSKIGRINTISREVYTLFYKKIM